MLSKTVYTKPTQCRLNPAYTTAYATYALCMEADAADITCVEFPLCSLFCIQEKKGCSDSISNHMSDKI